MNKFLVICLQFMLWLGNEGAVLTNRTFPDYFRFGTATSSYQIEGAWDADGKGENIWDHLTHTFPESVLDKSSGDIACNSYHNYLRDVEMVAELGVDFYRFSVSWGRIMPNGLTNNINQAGLNYYNNLIDALLRNGIEPMVTMYHWDLPQRIQDIGGWVNPVIVKMFINYAKVLFDNYGDRVKLWTTFNEPAVVCKAGYGGSFAPGLEMSGLADYQCSHNLLKAHAEVYHLYNNEYRASQKGRIGIVLNSAYFYAATDTDLDKEARQRAIQFQLGFYAHPIFHPNGDYPQVMIDRVANRSKEEGFDHSRMPFFTSAEINLIRGTSDYFGINHYSSYYASYVEDVTASEPNFSLDQGASTAYVESTVHGNNGSPYAPEGLRLLLRWIKDEYNSPEIIIAENGFADTGGTNDTNRKMYYQYYLNSVLEAIYDDGVNVTAYTAWSLMDNFEWLRGYADHFGIYYVDFDSSEKTRTIKKSGEFMKEVIKTRCLQDEGCDINNDVK